MSVWEWRVRGIGTTIVIRAGSPRDSAPTDRGALDSFLFRLDRRTPEIQDVARRILSTIGSPPLRPEGWSREFQWAARSGRLVFEEIPNTRVSIGAKSFDAPTPDPAPLPKSTKTPSDSAPTFFEVDVVDEVGEPIAGVPVTYDVQGETSVPTDGAGHTRLDGVTAQFGTASIEDLDALREAVRPRWDLIRPQEWVVPETDATVAPLTEGVGPQASILSETLHTMVIQPWVIRARLVGHCFDTNKAFILPAAVETVPGLASAVDEVRIWFDEHPESEALLIGHTDTTGDPSYNDPLSLERAESFLAFLTEDVDHWMGWYGNDRPFEKRWGQKEDRLMLEAIAKRQGLPLTADLVHVYQAGRGLTVDGIIGPQTRRALIEDYMGLQDTSLTVPQSMSVHGCGESFPRTAKPNEAGVAGQVLDDDAAQRRVEAFLFERGLGIQPPPPGSISPAGSLEYPEWVRRARHTREWSIARTHAIALRVKDAQLEPIAGARVLLDDPPTELTADGDGIVTIPFREGQTFRQVSWGRPTEPEPEFTTTFFLEFDDDDEGLERKLHNLGYPKDDPVRAFQREFNRPVTGSLDDIRDEVHLWHDHGPAPLDASSQVALDQSGPKPEPGVSPTDPTSKATVAGTATPALVVGVTVGGVPPEATDDVTVELVGQGGATVGLKHPMKPSGEQRFDGLSEDGTYELTVGIGRAHAGGAFFGFEKQTVTIKKGRKQAETNVRIPLATIRKHDDSGPAPIVVEKDKTVALLGRAVPTTASPSRNAGGGLSVDGPVNVELTTVKGLQASEAISASFVSLQQKIDNPQPGATGCEVTVLDRVGTHNLPFTVAELKSISCTVRATEPVSERKWMEQLQPTEWAKRHNRDESFDVNDTEFADLFNFIRGSRPLELEANVAPEGLGVSWSVERAPDDNAKLGKGLPTLTPSGLTAICELNETGTFFVSARLDHPQLDEPTARFLGLNMIEVVLESVTADIAPDSWSAFNLKDGSEELGALTTCEAEVRGFELTELNVSMVAQALVVLVAGGSDGRRGLPANLAELEFPPVTVGWVNNVWDAVISAEYDSTARIDAKLTQNPIDEDSSEAKRNEPIHPGESRHALAPPIVDNKYIGDGHLVEGPFLSTSEMTASGPRSLGMAVEARALDGPGLVVSRDFENESGGQATGRLSTMRFHAEFVCTLCVRAKNFAGDARPGEHSYVAVAAFNWSVSATASDYESSPTLSSFSTHKGFVNELGAVDARSVDCETRGPGASIARRYLLTY